MFAKMRICSLLEISHFPQCYQHSLMQQKKLFLDLTLYFSTVKPMVSTALMSELVRNSCVQYDFDPH